MSDVPERAVETAVREIVDGDATKSDKIRRLDELGLARADIAKALGIRYQFVRNVLVEDERRRAARRGEPLVDGGPYRPRSHPELAAGADRMPAPGAADHGTEGKGRADATVRPGAGAPSARYPGPVRATLAPGGRLAIPRPFLSALGIEEEGDVFLHVEQDEIRVYSRAEALRQAQELVARRAPSDVGLVDALLAERRREALEEEAGSG